jgi:tetratricopeptide (TPR) repeat protein
VLAKSPTDVDAVIEEAERRPVLFVFDDLDQMESGGQKELIQFLERLPLSSGSKAILLTRTRLAGFQDVDGIAAVRLVGMEPEIARQYLLYQAMLQDVSDLAFAPESTLDQVAERLGHHPKMMQFAVGWIKVLGLRDGWSRISRLPQPLTEKLEVLLAQSIAMLNSTDVEVLRTIGTFVGPFRAEWLAEVSGNQSLESFQTLMDSNLLDRNEVTGHYELHPIVRDYIAVTIPLDEVHYQRHAHFFAERVSQLAHNLVKEHDLSAVQEFDLLIDEVSQAVLRVERSEDIEARRLVGDLVAGVCEYLHFHRRDWAAIESLEDAAIKVWRTLLDRARLGAALTSYGAAVAAQGNLEEGLERCFEGLDHLAAVGDGHLQSVGYGALGFIHRLRGSKELAQRAYQQGLILAQDVGDPDLEVRHLSNLGTICRMAKDWEGAQRLHQQALELAFEIGNQMSAAILLDQLGINARHRGDLDASLRYHQHTLQLKASLGDRVGLRITRNSLASTLKQLGRPAEAIPLLEDSLMELDETNGVLEWWLVLLQLARMHRALEAWETARVYYEQALEMAQAARYLRGVSMCERGIGLCFEGEGHLSTAREHIARAVEISSQTDDPFLSTLLVELKRVETM